MRRPANSWMDERSKRYARLALSLVVIAIVVSAGLRYQWPEGENTGYALAAKIGGAIGYFGVLAWVLFGPCRIIRRDLFSDRGDG